MTDQQLSDERVDLCLSAVVGHLETYPHVFYRVECKAAIQQLRQRVQELKANDAVHVGQLKQSRQRVEELEAENKLLLDNSKDGLLEKRSLGCLHQNLQLQRQLAITRESCLALIGWDEEEGTETTTTGLVTLVGERLDILEQQLATEREARERAERERDEYQLAAHLCAVNAIQFTGDTGRWAAKRVYQTKYTEHFEKKTDAVIAAIRQDSQGGV